ncbi:helix-turn-helix domain-containing protein [Sphingobium nicotianae]|uniref:Helix-turn-helix domain-containing protein n=1 Tax=Sphingobium nicotianae TaxID=2782607 RepID=A0A9X1DD79_9SPHN|nr:helix-turn-helix domain-containing protein [Sphingobium nicotianae]MBT2187777.1 helix-turn-helix domain-containing protein [Sphingobium nicotianae]
MQNSAVMSTFAERPVAIPSPRLDPADGEAIRLGAVSLASLRPGAQAEPRAATCSLYFQVARSALGSVAGRPFRLDAGCWLVTLSAASRIEPMPGGQTLAFSFPADLLSRRLASQIQSRVSAAMPLGSAAKMCLELSRFHLAQNEAVAPSVADAVGESLVELAKLAIIEQLCEKRVESVRETVRARIQTFVQRNLVDPDLTIERIADRMQCTKRYLHKVFSDEGQTLNQYIWAQRLERCRSELCRAEQADKSITEIAFACGFSNAAHFSRSFRTRFGQPPRAYRRMMGAH